MRANLFMLPESFVYNGVDSLDTIKNKLCSLANDMRDIVHIQKEDNVFYYSYSVLCCEIFPDITFLDAIGRYLTKDQNTGDEKAWDVRSESFRYPDKRYKPQEMWLYTHNTFFRNLVYSLYGILNTKPNFKMEYNFTNQQALQCADDNIFARINCKKEVGYNRCLNNILEDAINNDRDFLKRQITLLDADIFVCCGYSKAIGESGNLMLNFLNTIGYNFKADKKESWIYYDEENNKIAINSYHLSYPGFDYEGMINAYFEFLTIHPEFINSHR